MNMNLFRRIEKGQVIPILVLMLFAIIGMIAILLDGGALMSNKRTAQAAADAGALAGAQLLCKGESNTIVETRALEYTDQNNATSATVAIVGKTVTVNAYVDQDSWFARIFNQDELDTGAVAEAGCYAPKGHAVLPLTWFCEPPGGGPFNPEYGCKMQTLSWPFIGPLVDPDWEPLSDRKTSLSIPDFDGFEKIYFMSSKYPSSIVDEDGIPPEQIYIVMDSDKVCREDIPETDPDYSTAIICDLDGDGKKEIQTGGDRGWLYLTADTNSINKWIKDIPPFDVQAHIWLSGKSGNDVSVYKDMLNEGFVGKVVLIPVFNSFCPDDPSDPNYAYCVTDAHTDPLPSGTDVFDEMRFKSDNYHIIVFQPFYIACVDKKGDCPGFNYARTFTNGSTLKDIAVLEGYFLTGVDVSLDPAQNCEVNLGNCTVSLSK